MKNIIFLSVKELKNSKKMVLKTIIGIIIVAILINSISTLVLSYQSYIVNLSREKENWEVKLENVNSKYIDNINKNNNIKEISIVKDIGISEESYNEWYTELLYIRGYNLNALKNLNIKLKKGKIPESIDEIVINENMLFKIGDIINTTINNTKYSFKVVGLIEDTEFDDFNPNSLVKINGAITYFDTDNLKEDEKVTIYAISKNISKIYDVTEELQKEINSNEIITTFNEELLKYSFVTKDGSEYQKNVINIAGLLICIVAISSISLIYTIFNINISEKKKYIGALLAIGANRKQIFFIYFIEGIIITIIAIPMGLILSFGIDNFLISIFNDMFKSMQNNIFNTTLKPNESVNLQLIFSWKILIISIISIFLIVLVSILGPIIGASKTNIIDMIRKNNYYKITKKNLNTPRIIKKLFNIEGELAYKNIKRSNFRYITMIISLTITVVLFISINGYIVNLNSYNSSNNQDYNYSFYLYKNYNQKDYSQEVINILNEFGLIDEYYSAQLFNPMYLYIEDENINKSLKSVLKKWDNLYEKCYGNYEDTNIGEKKAKLIARVITFDNDTYEKYLQKIGQDITLNKGECILVNYIDIKNKYYDGLYLTNYKSGDNIIITDKEDDPLMESLNIKSNEMELNIKIVTDVIPEGAYNDELTQTVYLVVNPKTFGDLWKKYYNIDYVENLEYYIQTSKAEELDEVISTINEKYKDIIHINSTNYDSMQKSIENENIIKEILLFSFLILICILCIINIFNIIISSIRSMKNEFAELIAIGKSRKQINKMLRLEGMFYIIISLVIGFFIGILILYYLYEKMINTEIYSFSIPLYIIISTVVLICLFVFISIKSAKKIIKNINLAQTLKNID